MVNLNTKFDKRARDNEKRRQSIKEKEKSKFNQCQIIKQALSNSTLNNSSRKIVFKEDDGDDNGVRETCRKPNNLSGNGKSVLFDSSESENEDFEIREKSQFSSKKGFELLNLQSTYGNDERFKIDERFLEEKEEVANKASNNEQDNATEKAQQLKILETVLGTPVSVPKSEKKNKKRVYEMVRYDAFNKDHEIYEFKSEARTPKPELKKRKEVKKTSKADKEEVSKPNVSQEKFYEVSNEITSCFKEKREEGGQFSLLQTYAVNSEIEEKKVKANDEDDDFEGELMNEENISNYDYKKEKGNNEYQIDKPKQEKKTTVARGIWKESFFFAEDDDRYKEGLEFMNKKNSEEASEASENYDKARRKLREILRLHVKKQMHKKDPFRVKVGGMNKKQLASSKFKNSRRGFNIKKPQRKNHARKI